MMKEYLTKKVVKAERCRAWKDFGSHKHGEMGYKVVYPDGYVSWCPEEEFEDHADELKNFFDFGDILHLWQEAPELKFARTHWNGKGMFLYLVPGWKDDPKLEPEKAAVGKDGKVEHGTFLAMCTATGDVMPWLANQADMLACDWYIVATDREIKEQGWELGLEGR